MSMDIKSLGSFVWSIAELLRGDFKQSEYGKVILPFVVLRRLDCILETSKQDVLDMAASLPKDMDEEARDALLSGVVGTNIRLYNESRFTFATLKGQDPKDIHRNLMDYMTFLPHTKPGFIRRVCSCNVRSNEENRRCANHVSPKQQIVGILQECAAGDEGLGAVPQARKCRRHALQVGSKYGGLQVSELIGAEGSRIENAELKRLLGRWHARQRGL